MVVEVEVLLLMELVFQEVVEQLIKVSLVVLLILVYLDNQVVAVVVLVQLV